MGTGRTDEQRAIFVGEFAAAFGAVGKFAHKCLPAGVVRSILLFSHRTSSLKSKLGKSTPVGEVCLACRCSQIGRKVADVQSNFLCDSDDSSLNA